MPKIRVTVQTREQREIDVEFPIFRAQHHDFATVYTRITADLRAVSVQISERRREVEYECTVEQHYNFLDGSALNYHLGRGEYQSSEAEFYMALNAMRTAMAGL